MKLIVGLGNPGRRYAGTRHNVGFDVLDLLARRHGAEWTMAPRGIEAVVAAGFSRTAPENGKLLLAKPLTFMNLSGHAVGDLLRFFKIELPGLFVIVDDVNLELGRLRARAGGSAGGHNGLKSLIAQLGTEAFARLRIGVGRGDQRCDLSDHVLAKFEPEERPIVAEAVERTADAAELFVTDGIELVMNRYNRREDAAKEDPD